MTEIKSGRLVSLDAFRGATIASMILVNNPGDGRTTFAPLLHASWHGWTFTDMVFPFFLWISGVAMTLSLASKPSKLVHIARRAAIIFAIGLFMNGFPYFNPSTIRIPGVLQRIAICYFFAGLIFLYTRWRGQIAAIVVLFAAYWAMMASYGSWDKAVNFSSYIDSLLLSGHMYSQTKTWDPEGIVSTLPAIATMLFGILTGHLLRLSIPRSEQACWIFLQGAALTWFGNYLDYWIPINKQIWTVSYSILMAGLASLIFACFYWLIDGQGQRRWTKFFVIYGMNAIAAYVIAGLVARILGLAQIKTPLYQYVFAPLAPPQIASLLYALTNVAVVFLAVWVMYRRKWFLRV